jgi:hypothetical protein
VTTLFYSAVHLVDAVLAPKLHPEEHEIRRMAVRRLPEFRAIQNDYRELEERSRDARYRCTPFSDTEVTALRTGTFEPLKTHVRRVLGE